MPYDLSAYAKNVLLLVAADVGRTLTKSSILDLGAPPAEGVLLNANVGALTGVDGSNYLTITAQHSDTTVDGDFATVPAGQLRGAFTVINSTSKDEVLQSVGYVGLKRYLRVVFTYTGTAISAGIVSASATVGGARNLPIGTITAVAAT